MRFQNVFHFSITYIESSEVNFSISYTPDSYATTVVYGSVGFRCEGLQFDKISEGLN